MTDATSKLEPYLLLAKSARGAASAKVIVNATSAPGVYVFSELLDQPSIQDLANTSHANHLTLLQLFAYGTLADYHSHSDTVPPLEPAQLLKLKQLSLVSLALKSRAIPYSTISETLQIDSVRELEDLIIDVMYAGLLGGKMHHDEKVLHIDWVTGRDVNPEDLPQVAQALANWCQTSSALLQALDEQIAHVRQTNQAEAAHRVKYNEERDEAYVKASRENKKGSKAKGGNYDPAPPGYSREREGFAAGWSVPNDERDLFSMPRATEQGSDDRRSKKRFKSDEMED